MSVKTNFSDQDFITGTPEPNLAKAFSKANQKKNQVKGTQQDDTLSGTQGDDQLFGYKGDDLIYASEGADSLMGGQGNDTFAIGVDIGSPTLAQADWITDFGKGQDVIQLLDNLTFDELNIFQGTGSDRQHTIIQHQSTGQYLAVLKNIQSNTLQQTDFLENPISSENEPPQAENDPLLESVLLRSRLEIPVADLLANDSDADGDTLTITAVSSDDGTVALNNGIITFQANPNFAGPASFEYIVSDGNGGTDTATASFNVISEVDLETLTTPTEQPIGVNGYAIYTDFPQTSDQGDWRLSATGDVNGDGLDDVVIGTPWTDTYDIGGVRVVYGKSDETPTSIFDADGFSFGGRFGDVGFAFGRSVGNGGDFNGDGFADAIAGGITAWVFPGLPGWVDIGLGAPNGSGGQLSIDSEISGDNTGTSVNGGGDINGDGLDDVVFLGSGGRYADTLDDNSRAYVVFGTQSLETINLSDIDAGQGGFIIDNIAPYGSVSVAGDVNGDGLEDVIVSNLDWLSTTSYVVFGKQDTQPVDVNTLAQTQAGFALIVNDVVRKVSSAGDVNGDGLEDVILGSSNAAYVVFGKTDSQTVDLNALGDNGFTIESDIPLSSRDFVSTAGDFNADGLDDVIVGTPEKAYIVFGKNDSGTVNLTEVANGNGGFALNGGGNSVSDAGDINGDGFADVIVGTSAQWYNTGTDFVGAYVVFGGDVTASVTHQGTEDNDLLTGTSNADVMIGGQGDDELIGNGGADVLYGGAGNDIIAISDSNFKRLDGGNGIDTLRLDGNNLTLDLTTISNSKLQSLEQIDLRDVGNQTLTFNLTDFLNLVGNNPSQPGTLTILGDPNDTVNANLLGDAPIFTDQGISGGFRSFSNGYATLRVSTEVALNITLDTPPVAGDDEIEGTVLLGSPVQISSTTLLANDTDADDDFLTITAVASEDGKASLKDGVITFQANPNVIGPVSFEYTVDDGHGGTDIGTVNLSVVSELDLEAIATQTNLPIGADGFVIYGNNPNTTRHIVSDAGDVNGDGLDDLIIGIYNESSNPQSYVVFGKAESTGIDLNAIESGVGGFVINGAGFSVSGVGDVNNDGLSDLIASHGDSYVVFGKSDTNPVDVTDLATGMEGFAINRTATTEGNGFSVSDAGDVNGDGLADVIIGDPWASVNGNTQAGKSFVVFGQTEGTNINLEDVTNGIGGFVINGGNSGDQSGYAVSDAGDVNGDGLADVIVGSYFAGINGEAYVIFGKTDGTAINLNDIAIGNGGFAIAGSSTHSLSGKSVSGGGDINGDGLSDVIVSASYSDGYTGHAYVIFGQANVTSVNLDEVAVGNGGFIINGIAAYDGLGVSVSDAGDVNGDGFDDLIIGAKYGTPDGKTWAGKSYVVFGQPNITEVNIDQIEAGIGGFVLNGIDNYDFAGISVSGAGDVNGDGFADMLVGAKNAQNGSGVGTGDSYIIFGGDFMASVTHPGTAGDDILTGRIAYDLLRGNAITDVMIGDQGDDELIGNGGADILYGGADDDVIGIGSSSYTTPLFKRIDGGSGTDTIRLDSYTNLDLTSIRDPLIQGIEQIDLNQSVNNILTLNVSDLQNLSDTSNTLTVMGGTTDRLNANLMGAGFVDNGVTDGFQEYSNGVTTLRVADVITQNVNI